MLLEKIFRNRTDGKQIIIDVLSVQTIAKWKLFIPTSQYTGGRQMSAQQIKAKSGAISLCCTQDQIIQPETTIVGQADSEKVC
jgi:hypothetical protein